MSEEQVQLGSNLEDTDLIEEKISFDTITLKSFLPLIAKRVVFFILKSVGSRTMNWTLVEYITAVFLMSLFATSNLTTEVMNAIFYLYISQAIIVLVMFGLLKFDPIKANINSGINIGK